MRPEAGKDAEKQKMRTCREKGPAISRFGPATSPSVGEPDKLTRTARTCVTVFWADPLRSSHHRPHQLSGQRPESGNHSSDPTADEHRCRGRSREVQLADAGKSTGIKVGDPLEGCPDPSHCHRGLLNVFGFSSGPSIQ